MGVYLNPGNQKFRETVSSRIYVDKTEMIAYLNTVVQTEQKYVSVSRPRRFGKTIAANMLCAYYGKGDSRELFANRKLAAHENWEQYRNRFDVIRVVMTDFIKENLEVASSLKKMVGRILTDLTEAYPEVTVDPEDLGYSMDCICRKNDTRFVVIIDEWDVVFRERKEDQEGQKLYLDFLRDWLKDKEYIALAYMTGILPIKKYGKHSALNMFDEYSIISPMQLAPYAGFTEEEVRELCDAYGRDYEQIREWYDGYEVRSVLPPDPHHEMQIENGTLPCLKRYEIYNPLSVVKSVSTGMIQNYWNMTETYAALEEYIKMDFDGLKETVALLMDDGRVAVDISKYQNDMTSFTGRDDVLAMLIHLGYLGYDMETKEVFIPNKELFDVFRVSTESGEWIGTFRSFKKSQELLRATWNGNEERVAELLEYFHDTAENKTYHSEAALSYAVQLAYYAAQKYYTIIQELDAGKGYVDLVYLPSPAYPDKPALLVELKYNKDVRTAADQIRNRDYPQKLAHYQGNLFLISINYSKDAQSDNEDFKRHSCQIERW